MPFSAGLPGRLWASLSRGRRRALPLLALAAALCALAQGCSSSPPGNPGNLCSVFQEKDSWYSAAHEVHDKYGIPIHVAMAIMYRESGYEAGAKPPMTWFLFIPTGRESSAYGYAQALDSTWDEYVSEAGSFFSDRDEFADALDFIGWYMSKTKQVNGVPFSDAYNQYLNYHEGHAGFRAGSYESKDWLKKAAREVEKLSETYRKQLLRCQLY
ncbi:MAG: hypothetical protein K6A65_04050 [Succinivibrionaceae bacterium]|nr:hypothetical protein [Succinivibrionaceae bacterium]